MPDPIPPHDLLSSRLAERGETVFRYSIRERRLSMSRLACAAAFAVAAWLAFVSEVVSGTVLFFPFFLFILLAVLHDRTLKRLASAKRAVAYYQHALRRLSGEWAGSGATGDRFLEAHHPYASDLDLFGKGSLFQLLSETRTPDGEAKLAEWLLTPSDPGEIRRRQQAVVELRDALDLREAIHAEASEVAGTLRTDLLTTWASRPPLLNSSLERVAAGLMALLTFGALLIAFPAVVGGLLSLTHPESVRLAGSITVLGPLPLLIMIAIELLFVRRMAPRVDSVLAAIETAEEHLSLLERLLRRVERETFQSKKLVQIRTALGSGQTAASRQIDELRRLTVLLDSARNQFFVPFAALLLWRTQIAFSVEKWRRRSGAAITTWITSLAELETLLSLAAYTFEHPRSTFPEIVEGENVFDAAGLGHPLLLPSRAVTNDVHLGSEPRLLLVSGSNMSGKSTLMRSVGVNVVLALMGAPVTAGRLRVSSLRLGASIRVEDSVLEGSSRFYAEISRIRQIMDLAGNDHPLLFLLDEILHGTNSHDRRIGAEAVIRGLLDRGSIGIVSTHDLALASMAEGLGSMARNVHFQDHLEEGKMVFDYVMRPGVVTRSNALELMRAIGLEV